MKKILLLCLLCASMTNSFSQNQNFDITTYTAPKGWVKEVQENSTSYTISDKQKNSWCRIFIVKSTVSKGSIEADFESEWQELIVKNYHPVDKPQVNEVQETKGWKIKSGLGKFTFSNTDAIAFLSTMSGNQRCASIVAITNSQDYLPQIQKILASVDLEKAGINPQPTIVNKDSSIVGTWSKVASDQGSVMANNAVAGYIMRQYTFNKNGTYWHLIKTFSNFSDLLLTKESGTYQVSRNNITVTPQKAVIESWSKKNNSGDDWGTLKSIEDATMEITTYKFTIEYNAYIKETQLIIQASQATNREGPFDRDNKCYYQLPKHDYNFIKLPQKSEL